MQAAAETLPTARGAQCLQRRRCRKTPALTLRQVAGPLACCAEACRTPGGVVLNRRARERTCRACPLSPQLWWVQRLGRLSSALSPFPTHHYPLLWPPSAAPPLFLRARIQVQALNSAGSAHHLCLPAERCWACQRGAEAACPPAPADPSAASLGLRASDAGPAPPPLALCLTGSCWPPAAVPPHRWPAPGGSLPLHTHIASG
mmetsp:Transcript_3703/g.10015  ORF Transcript_3703/g.10015 Transcript_3703/m.10015 type:complete len:203 (-) Transcript_3703:820-1428(-)